MATWTPINKSNTNFSLLVTYQVGNVVAYLGNLYKCILADTLGVLPTVTDNWKKLYTNESKNTSACTNTTKS